MKILLLSGANSPHTLNWANSLSEAGCDVYVASQHEATAGYNPDINMICLPSNGVTGFLKSVCILRKLLKKIQPDIVNAHRAIRYSLLARLINYRPFVISVWGSDVYDFPYTSKLHHAFVRSNLMAADAVASTSLCMAKQTRVLAPALKEIAITPFGVDMTAYADLQPASAENNKQIIIGTVKTMAHKYGIDTLLEAFALLMETDTAKEQGLTDRLVLRLVGDGPQTDEYKKLAITLGIQNKVIFVGRVPHADVPNELAKLDIYVALSRLDSESFGVAIIEAGAAGRPVLVSDAGGLPEVTLQDKTGLIVPRENPQAAAEAIEKLILDPELRTRMGINGHNHVKENYSREVCTQKMIDFYHEIIAKQPKEY